jgi:hypothetical protein
METSERPNSVDTLPAANIALRRSRRFEFLTGGTGGSFGDTAPIREHQGGEAGEEAGQ